MEGMTKGAVGGPSAPALVRRFGRDEFGATAIEYAIIAGSLSIAIVVGVGATGLGLSDIFDDIAAIAF